MDVRPEPPPSTLPATRRSALAERKPFTRATAARSRGPRGSRRLVMVAVAAIVAAGAAVGGLVLSRSGDQAAPDVVEAAAGAPDPPVETSTEPTSGPTTASLLAGKAGESTVPKKESNSIGDTGPNSPKVSPVDALAGYGKALSARPNDAGLLIERGRLLAGLGRWSEADADFTHAAQAAPGGAPAVRRRRLVGRRPLSS